MFALCSDITIGKYVRVKPNAVKVTKSVYEFVDKAVVKLPLTARIKQSGTIVSSSMDTAKAINEGDYVSIKLGYNGKLVTEFEGFVSRVNLTTPLELECEGYSYLLRNKTYTGKSFKKAKLIEILHYLTNGTSIIVEQKSTADIVVEKFLCQGESGTELLEALKKAAWFNQFQICR